MKIKFIIVLFNCFLIMLGVVKSIDATTREEGSGKVFWRDIMSYGGGYGYDRTLALDNNDYPHICSYSYSGVKEYGIRHVYWDGTNWQSEFISDLGGGRYCSIAINQTNNDIYISYYGLGDLMYRKKSNGSWGDLETVDSTGDTGLYTSIVLTSNGTPHIFYQYHIDGSNNRLKHAYWTGESWHLGTVLPGNLGYYNSAAVDQNDNIHVAYYDWDDNDVEYVLWYSNGTWYPSAVLVGETGGPSGLSLVVGSDNLVRVSYNLLGPDSALKIATGTTAGFTDFDWDSHFDYLLGQFSSLALDSQNNSFVSYYYQNQGLKYASNSSGSVATEVITSEVGKNTSLAYRNENAFISYFNETDNNLNFVLLDLAAPTGSLAITGKSGSQIAWSLTAADYAKMGGPRYYCADENNTCDPTIELTSATVSSNTTVSDNVVYVRLKDWAGNVSSLSATHQPASEETTKKEIPVKGQKVVGYDLTYKWLKVPKNASKWWLQTTRYKKYPPKKITLERKRNFIKRYWTVKTNLYKYQKKAGKELRKAENNYYGCIYGMGCSSDVINKYKKQIKEWRKKNVKVRFAFYSKKKLELALRKRNSYLKQFSRKEARKKMFLKIYNKKTNNWIDVSPSKYLENAKHKVKKSRYLVDIRYFKDKKTKFAIGLQGNF